MGQSGFDIMDSDQAQDVQYYYFERYNAGKSPAEIYKWFQEENKFLFEGKVIEDVTNFWLALAHCQWEVKALEPFVAECVKEIVESDLEKEDWEENYAERKKMLQKFLVKIGKEKKTAKKPVKQKLFKAPYEKGDIVTYPIYDLDAKAFTTTWGLSVCVENTQGLQKIGKSLFIGSGLEKSEPATMEDFDKAYALAGRSGNAGFTCKCMSEYAELGDLDKISKIGKVEVTRSFCMNSYASGFSWVFPYSYNFVRGEKRDTSVKMSEAISIPESPYSKIAEKIVSFECMVYNDPRREDPLTYKETANFLRTLRKTDKKTFQNEFTNFIISYLFSDSQKVYYLFRSIVKSAGYSIDSLE
jgi:hypothetical protein